MNNKITLAIIKILIHLFVICGGGINGYASDSEGANKSNQKCSTSKPEDVLTCFVEADLSDYSNRSDDDRYPLWWDLTENGGAPQDSLKFVVRSYKIQQLGTYDAKTAVLGLEIDARALVSNGQKIEDWRKLTVSTNGVTYSTNTNVFVESIFGKGEISERIRAREDDLYTLPIKNRTLMFTIKVIKKNGKWVISKENIPLEMTRLQEAIAYFTTLKKMDVANNDVCDDKLSFKIYINKKLQNGYVLSEVKGDEKKFRRKMCTDDGYKSRLESISSFSKILATLDSLSKE
ncbi:hypothetical protein GMSM_39790 [Geomonas sp. Red276]